MNEGERKTLIRHGYLEDDGSSSIERYIKHHGVPKNWDSFVGGFLGGTAMGGMFNGFAKIKNTYLVLPRCSKKIKNSRRSPLSTHCGVTNVTI